MIFNDIIVLLTDIPHLVRSPCSNVNNLFLSKPNVNEGKGNQIDEEPKSVCVCNEIGND